MAHIALAVSNQERSRGFYETYFGFDPHTAWVAEDGVLLIEGPGGVTLALGETDEPIERRASSTSASRARPTPEEVRAFRDRLAGDGIEIAEFADEPEYVSVKCKNPDGYVIEFAWEPDD
jgi:catechol 2,3-dioxygenase-like lactoylglutathione lyase family enzyme